MKTTLILAAAAMMAISAPALAQSNGSPGASTAGSGSNTPGSGVEPNTPHNANGAMMKNDGMKTNGMSEGRAATTTNTPGNSANTTPKTVQGDQKGQDQAK